jgi:YD repeat-containing protein
LLRTLTLLVLGASLAPPALGAPGPAEMTDPDGRSVYSYEGDLLVAERRFDLTGAAVGATTYSYDAAGQLLRERSDEPGAPAYLLSYSWDDAGNLTELRVDEDGDGTTDSLTRYTWDASGHLLTEDAPATAAWPASRVSYAYDDAGRVRTRGWDDGADGLIDEIVTYTYDGSSERVVTEIARAADGHLIGRTDIAWDAAGHAVREATDEDGDGAVDLVLMYTYDAAGELSRVEERRGEVQLVTEYRTATP